MKFDAPQFFQSRYTVYRTARYAGVAVLFLLLLLRIFIIFSYVPEITGVDNNFVYTVTRLLAHLSPYPDPEAFPYAGNIYSPLFFTVCALVGKIAGTNPEYPIQVFRLCRAVSLLFDIASIYFLYRILTNHVRLATPFALLIISFFATLLCYLAYTFSRVDSLFLTIYAAVFYSLTKEEATSRYSFVAGLSILCSCCIFSKQNGIILPLLVCAWFYFSAQRKLMLSFLLFFSTSFTALFLFYTHLLHYNYLTAYTIKGVHNRIDPTWFYVTIFKPLANSVLLLPLAVAFAVAVYVFLINKPAPSKGYAAVYIIQIIFSTGAAFKYGSSLGYYNESLFLAMILLPKFSGIRKINIPAQNGLFWYAVPIACVFFLHVLLQDYLFFIHQYAERETEYSQQERVRNYIRSNLNGKHVFDLNDPNRDFFKNFFYKEMAVPYFDTVDCCLLPDGIFDYTRLKEELKSGDIQYIIFSKDKVYHSIWGVSLEHYKKDTSLYTYDLYKFSTAH